MQDDNGSDVSGSEILAVDDTPADLRLLTGILTEAGFAVRPADSGDIALRTVETRRPDLILLDIRMPDPAGLEVCRRLKAEPGTRDIPVIFISALGDTGEKVRAFEAGGVDYITKPFQKEEVLARVDTHLRLRQMQKSLERERNQLEERVGERTAELEAANRELTREIAERNKTEVRLKHLNAILLAVRNVSQLITSEKDRDRLTQDACRHLVASRIFQSAWIILLDETEKPIATAEAGYGEDFQFVVRMLEDGRPTACVRKALSQPGAVITHNPVPACEDCPVAIEHEGREAMSMQLAYSGKAYGVMTVSLMKKSSIATEVLNLFEEVVQDFGLGLSGIEREEALRESEMRFRDLYENAPNAYFSIGPDGRIRGCNRRAVELLGYAVEELVDRPVIELYADAPQGKEKALEILEGYLAGEEIVDEELQMQRADGAFIWISLTVNAVLDDQGRVLESRSMVVDITERKRLETQLRQAQKMEAIGTLAGGIAHDFNNILSAIIGFGQLARRQAEQGTSLYVNIEEVLQGGLRAKDLVRQILAFSRQSDKSPAPINMELIVEEALKLLRATLPATVDISTDIEENLPPTMGDPTQIHQIVINLCTNADHAMREDGGVLRVSLKAVTLDTDSASRHPELAPGPYLELTISDTGCGMTPEVVERIFEPYFTTKEKGVGTGMGLAMVQGIVRECGGEITVESRVGSGTRETASEQPSEASIPTGHERILFGDDELPLTRLAEQMLGQLGYEVTVRTGSVEALELFRTDPYRFDLVITDLTMPDLSGDKLTVEMMRIRPDLPVVLCTGFNERITEADIAGAGIRAFLMKPPLLHQLAQTIRGALDD